jgi:hypothetical protein
MSDEETNCRHMCCISLWTRRCSGRRKEYQNRMGTNSLWSIEFTPWELWSMDSETVQKFQPSGVGTQICRSGDYTILYNHGLYWSNEENPDTSQDMHASVIIFKGAKRVFVGRGYKYLEFQANPWENTFSFQHWTGTMGHNQITHYAFTVTDDALQLATRKSNA